jgi:plasmid maintenance system antidote protein VapI
MVDSEFQPDWASPPGETLADLLHRKGIDFPYFARQIDCSGDVLDALFRGEVPLTTDLAERLERVIGIRASFWITREAQYRTDIQRVRLLDQGRPWLDELPLKDMQRFGWIEPQPTLSMWIEACLHYFGVHDVGSWRLTYQNVLEGAFRTSSSLQSDIGSVAAWLRQGELQASQLQCGPWDPASFRDTLNRVRSLTKIKDPQTFVPRLQKLCAESGVAVAVVRAPKGCRASGATRFMSPTSALLLLSFRHLSDDHFWFSFFHEAGHLLLHEKKLILETPEGIGHREESEANAFAAHILVPPDLQAALRALKPSTLEVIKFARRVGVSPGIIVGQLQHLGRIAPNQLNGLKRRYKWVE